LENGQRVVSETRTFNAGDGKTYGMRAKEELNDYRYFPDPDLSPVVVSDEWLNEIMAGMPTLARALQAKFVSQYGLPDYDAGVLTDMREMAEYFEEVCKYTANFKAASNWIMGPVKSYLNERPSMGTFPLQPRKLASLIDLVAEGEVSFALAAQKILPELLAHPESHPSELASSMNLVQESDADLIMPYVEEVIREFPLKVEAYKNGKKGIISMFMGEVMKRSKGKADPRMATKLLEKKLDEQ
jgi:aspartyl-tRNA(Asn)/glutamyl-tRNA(Gln) amidotransferase subunit B